MIEKSRMPVVNILYWMNKLFRGFVVDIVQTKGFLTESAMIPHRFSFGSEGQTVTVRKILFKINLKILFILKFTCK